MPDIQDELSDEKSLATLQKIWKSQSIANEKSNFSCPTCQEKFKMKSKLVVHRYAKHGFGIKCKICSRTFSNISACTTHLSTKHSGQGYPCGDCDFETGKKSKFKNHLIENHRKCLKPTNKNMKTKSNEKGKENERQDESSAKPADKNVTNSAGKRNFSCELCETSFTIKNQLLRHKNEKHGIDIKCEICTQVFSSMVSLRSHKFTKHTGKDKICEICGYSTKKTYDFKRHQVKHSNEYTVMCLVCNKGFYSLYEFNEHKNVHTAERPYQCEVCGVDYSRRSSLILHRNRKHPEIYDSSKRCYICNQVCLTKETMEAHVKTHVEGRKRFYCDICGKGLLTRVILKIHRRSHTGEKPFDCSYCGRAFSCKKNLSVHIRLHTGDRPYSCNVCWKAYTKSSALKAHEKTHASRHVLS